MDDIVKQAMIKWPNVPNCYGWLGLDARGNWYMRDDRSQSLGSFASGVPGAKGSLLQHAKLIEFIQRNYAADASGQWYFQNGPQRVYVELEVTPWIWRVGANFSVTAHDGRAVAWKHSWMDENGWLYCETSLGFGLVHTQDVAVAAEAIEQGIWSVQDTLRSTLPMRWAYLESPQSLQATKKPDQ
jgi:hypothetical protein